MSTEHHKSRFLQSIEGWICDPYSIDIRYIVRIESGASRLSDASITLSPLPFPTRMAFHVESPLLNAGQLQMINVPSAELLARVAAAANGQIDIAKVSIGLGNARPYQYWSDMARRDLWFSPLHLQVIGEQEPNTATVDIAAVDGALRRASNPFDGVADLAGWLGLADPYMARSAPSINVRVLPPVDLFGPGCTLQDDRLRLEIHAHSRFDISKIGLAVRAVPGVGIESRLQAASRIKWKRPADGLRRGVIDIPLAKADSALTILMIGDSTVRRQWFIDSIKARNNRLAAVQQFDKDLRMIRQAVLESSDATRFELGVAALLFLHGFSPTVLLETDAPDLIVTTPGGRLVIVECTMRIADFQSKLGKLIDRRGALSKSMQAGGHPTRVDAVLVCALPRDQVAADEATLARHQAILLTKDDLAKAIERARFPMDPDKMLEDASAQFDSAAGRRSPFAQANG